MKHKIKFITRRSIVEMISVALVVALAIVLSGIPQLFAAYPEPSASESIDPNHIVTMYAEDIVDNYPLDENIMDPRPYSGALWDYFPSAQASGTGVFNTYLAVIPSGELVVERGFNTGGKCNDYDVDDSKTSALPLSEVPIVVIDMGSGPVAYREFCCDVNEVASTNITELISLEVLQIWQSDSNDLCGQYSMSPAYNFTIAEPDLIYDLDWDYNYTVILDYGVNTGSGKPDYKVFVPYDWFNDKEFVVIVVCHGNLEVYDPVTYTGYGASDGFEEWGVRVIDDTTPPTVVSTFPDNGAIDVAVDAVITATFSETMDASTITVDSFTLAGSVVSGTVTYSPATYTATFDPDANLECNHGYTATLSTVIKDVAGNPLTVPYIWNFTTESVPNHDLSISSTSGGSVTVPGEATYTYVDGTVVNLVAEAEEGYYFVNWTGDVSTIANTNAIVTTITMNDDYEITANFEQIPPGQFSLTISSTNGGSVTVPGEATYIYDEGTVVNLVAEGEEGYYFDNWTGNVSTVTDVNAATTTITMNGDYYITANFEVDSPFPIGCFIATAAYGTPMSSEIQILREFRDGYLLTNPLGQNFVDFYYKASPPIAEFITEHSELKPIVRVALVPAVAMSTVVVDTTVGEKIAIVGSLVLIALVVAVLAARRRARPDGSYSN